MGIILLGGGCLIPIPIILYPFGTWFLVVDGVELSELDWGFFVLHIHRNRTIPSMTMTPLLVTYLAACFSRRTLDAGDIAQNS